MRIKTIVPLMVALAIFTWVSVPAAEESKPATPAADGSAEAKAKADYEAAETGAKEAEAAVAPLKTAMQQADTAYADATKTANAKRQQATDAKNLAGEPGVKELKQAEENVPAATQALTEATNAKPGLDQALADAKAAAAPLQQAYDAAEKAAKEAEAVAKAAADAANKLDDEAKRATTQEATLRRVADSAKATLTRAQQNEQQATEKATTAAQKLAEPEMQMKAADETLAKANNQVSAATTAYQAAEQAATAVEASAKPVSEAEKQQAAADAAAKRKAADAAKAALTQAQQNQQQAQAQADAAVKNLADAPAQKKVADEALGNAKNQAAAATTASQTAEQAAQAAEAAAKAVSGDAAKSPEEKKKAADDAAAKRKAADEAKTALTQAQQNQQQAQAQADAAVKNLADAPARKKAADEALAGVKNQVAAAATASQTAEQTAQAAEAAAKAMAERAGRSDQQKQQAAADAAVKRKAADDAKAALAQAQAAQRDLQKLADAASQKLDRVTGQKEQADAALASVKSQIAAAIKASQAADEAAQAAAKTAEEKRQAAAQAAAKLKAATDAAAALAQAQQGEQQAQAQATAAQKLTGAEPAKKSADEALANAKNQVAAATAANQAAQEAAKEFVQLDAANKQAAADAAAKRKAANEAKAALAPVAQKLEQAAIAANAGTQKLDQAQARKKSAEEGLENLKKRIAAAKETHVADEQAAKVAEAAAVPLKAEADKTRAAYEAALKVADDKRALAEQAKAALYRLVAARQVASLMESPEPPKPANRIDEIVFAKLKTLGIQPILCSDAVFIRRAYLDLTGKLPTADEAKAFIQSAEPNKRVALIDRLLDQPAHVDYWAMRWGDILRVKAEFPVKVWPNAAQAYHRWVWESIIQNKPYDQFVRELLTSSGSNFRVGPVNFYRAIQDKTPEGIAGAVGLALMGTRIHLWPQERRAGMAVFFSQVGYKPTNEWKEEVVFWDPLNSVAVPGNTAPGEDSVAKAVTVTNQIPQTLAKPLSENGPLEAVFPDGAKTTIPPNRDPREVFADWLIRPENPWLAKTIANRTWAWAMGRGIIHEPDDIRDDNPPSNPELLAYLEKELVSNRYDLKHLKRLIFTSTTYQFSSIPHFKGPEARANFASYLLRRVEAEVLIDGLNGITGSSDLYTSAVPEPFSYIPSDVSAVALADGSITSSFLTLFGRSSRSTGMEGERVSELASPQWLYMLNSGQMQNKLQSGSKLAALLSAGGQPNEIAERLYLTILSRFPTEADLKAVEGYAKTGVKGRDAWIDLTWALINSPEFLLRH
jgi:hypothetical protein